jgi:hypothetical protein
MGRGLSQVANELVQEYERWPNEFWLAVLGTFLAIEGSALLTGFLAAGWAAADEPFRASLVAGVRRTWLGTSLLLPAILFVSGVGTTVDQAQMRWQQAWAVHWPTLPERPPNLQRGSPEWDEFQAKIEEHRWAYQQARREYERTKPWYVRHAAVIIAAALSLALAWAIWTWLRGASAERELPPREHPPWCEWCGYNLTHASAEGRCPECGQAIEVSLGPHLRPGSPWEDRAAVGRWRAWRQCAWEAMARPLAFGRRLRLRTRVTAHGAFLATCILPLIACAWVGWLGFYAAVEGDPFAAGRRDLLGMFLMMAVFTAAFLLAVLCLVALLVGAGYAYRDRRNLLPVTIQAAAYLAPFLMLWTLFAGFAAVAVVLLEPVYERVNALLGWGRFMGFGPYWLQLTSWVLANLACLLLYIHLVTRITSAARYANR